MTNISGLSQALKQTQRSAVLDLLRSQPGMTLAELTELVQAQGKDISGITIGELISGKPGSASGGKRVRRTKKAAKAKASGRRRGRPKKIDTRTAEGRALYDEAVLAAVSQYEDKVSADAIRADARGTNEQVRSSLARLVKGKQVKRSGKGRGTLYQAV